MKRSSSDIDPPCSPTQSFASEDFKPEVTPPPRSKAQKASTPNSAPKKKAKKDGSGSSADGAGGNGEWTPEKRAQFMDLIIAAGYKSVNLDDMASSLGMGRKQLVNQLTPGRKGSFREKAVIAVKGTGLL